MTRKVGCEDGLKKNLYYTQRETAEDLFDHDEPRAQRFQPTHSCVGEQTYAVTKNEVSHENDLAAQHRK